MPLWCTLVRMDDRMAMGSVLSPISEQLPSLVYSLEHGRALGLITIDGAELRRIERHYGADAMRGALQVLVRTIQPVVSEALGDAYLLLRQDLREEQILLFSPRPLSDRGFYTHTLPRLAERLRRHIDAAVGRVSYPYISAPVTIPVGWGIALHRPFQRPEREIAQLIHSALAEGVFQAECFRRERASLLERLIIEESLSTLYEPIKSLQERSVLGYEALTRGPVGTSLESPIACFTVAQENDLDYELDSVCRRLALQHAAGLPADQMLFLNILPSSIQDPDFSNDRVQSTLAEMTVEPRRIVFEISERESIGNYALFGEALDRLSNLGFSIAIDDVGAGYANLETALELRPDFLKLDRNIVHRIEEDGQKQELIRALVRVAKKMGARVIAEGIERDADLEMLRELGVGYGQGYAIGRASPVLMKQG